MSKGIWKKCGGVAASFWFLVSLLSAQEPQEAKAGNLNIVGRTITLEAQLDKAIEEYEKLSAEISEKKLALVTPLNNKRIRVSQLRNQTDMLLLKRSERLSVVERIEEQNTGQAEQIDFIDALIVDHLSNFDTLVHPAEDQLYRPHFTELRNKKNESASREEQMLAQLEVLDLSFQRIEKALGGYTFDGKAVTEDGDILEGSITLTGPTAYFASGDKQSAGALEFETNSLLPELSAVPEIGIDQVQALSSGRSTDFPIDITLGQAKEFGQTEWSLEEHVEKGGMVGYVILGFAAVALLIVLLKIVDLTRVRGLHTIPVADLVEHRLTHGNEAALVMAEKKPFPANRVLSVALKYADHQTDVIEEVIIGEIRTVKTRLERLLPFLAIIAATAPLMGLLGTVVGMIKTFSLITVFGSGNAQSFSAGISEALVTTEFGLVVAIPTLIVHGVLLRSAREKLGSLEDLASEFVISLQEARKESA